MGERSWVVGLRASGPQVLAWPHHQYQHHHRKYIWENPTAPLICCTFSCPCWEPGGLMWPTVHLEYEASVPRGGQSWDCGLGPEFYNDSVRLCELI